MLVCARVQCSDSTGGLKGDKQGRLFIWTQQQVNTFHVEHYIKMDCLNAFRVYFGWDPHRGSGEGGTELETISMRIICSSASKENPKALSSVGLNSVCGALQYCREMLRWGSTNRYLPK